MKNLLLIIALALLPVSLYAAPEIEPIYVNNELYAISIRVDHATLGTIYVGVTKNEVAFNVDANGELTNKAQVRLALRAKYRAKVAQMLAERQAAADFETAKSAAKLKLNLTVSDGDL